MYPQDWLQLLIVIAAVVPGFVYQISRRRVRGPGPDEQSVSIRVLRSIATSVVFLGVYIICLGFPLPGFTIDEQGLPREWRLVALWVLLLVLVVPWLAAKIVFYIVTSSPVEKFAASFSERFNLRRQWDPTPSAWDFAFSNRGEGWVRVQTVEGVWMGGWYGASSFASSFPDPREIFLEVGYAMNDDGRFAGAVSAPGGLYIRCDEARLVDFTPDPLVDPVVADG